jgi:IS30 family transposase
MSYQQLTSIERYILSALRKQGLSIAVMARILDRHRSTIYREFERNSCHRTDGHYRPTKAHPRAIRRRSESRRNLHYTQEDFRQVRRLLKRKWSPEQIHGYLRSYGLRSMSHETIYQYVWRDKAAGGKLWTHLRQSPKIRRKRYGLYDGRGRLADKRNISERPQSVENRRYKGHWEIDTVMGKGSRDCIVTLGERKTGFLMIGKLTDRTNAALNRRTKMLIRRDSSAFKTITADNGTEFHHYKVVERDCNALFYFANPYHSWERGTNENANGLIRQYLPKGKTMAKLNQRQCDNIAMKINQRPRKRHGFKTPEQQYNGQ